MGTENGITEHILSPDEPHADRGLKNISEQEIRSFLEGGSILTARIVHDICRQFKSSPENAAGVTHIFNTGAAAGKFNTMSDKDILSLKVMQRPEFAPIKNQFEKIHDGLQRSLKGIEEALETEDVADLKISVKINPALEKAIFCNPKFTEPLASLALESSPDPALLKRFEKAVGQERKFMQGQSIESLQSDIKSIEVSIEKMGY